MSAAAHVADEHITSKPYNKHSQVYENAIVVLSGKGLLYGFTVYNSGAAQFVQWFDLGKLPATGDIPDGVLAVAATSSQGVAWLPGRSFHSGIVLVNSSTGPTYTAGAADCFFDAQYI